MPVMRFFRANATHAIPAIHTRLEEAGYFHAIGLPANAEGFEIPPRGWVVERTFA